MGGKPSYELPDIQSTPLDSPVVAIDARFCHNELVTVTLQRKPGMFDAGVEIRSVGTNAVKFTIDRPTLTSRQTLLDDNNAAIANFRPRQFSTKPIHYVHIGSQHKGDAVFEIYARNRGGFKTEVRVTFTDSRTREQCQLGFEGHWRNRTGHFWLDRGNRGVHEPVAKVFCPDSDPYTGCHIAIAPHMDAALIAMVCAILSEQDKSSSDWCCGALDLFGDGC